MENKEGPRDVEKGGWVDVSFAKGDMFDADALTLMNSEKNMDTLKVRGGVEGIARHLGTDSQRGIDHATETERKTMYGFNKLPEKPGASFFALLVRIACVRQ